MTPTPTELARTLRRTAALFLVGAAALCVRGRRWLRRRQSPLWGSVPRTLIPPAGAAPAVRDAARPAGDLRPGTETPPTAGHVLQGLFWAGGSFLGGKLLVFASVVVLARLLSPRDFGSVALAMSALLVFEVFGTLGLTSALIYESGAVADAAQACFCVTVPASLVEAATACAVAAPLSRFFHDPMLAPMLRVLSGALVLTALGSTHDALLRRRLAFDRKIIPDLAMAGVKGTLSIALACAGLGAWSLIWAQVLGSAAATLLLWKVERWRPVRAWNGAAARRLFAYGKHIYLLDGTSTALSNLDSLVIGRMLNDSVLGFYSLAFRIPEVLLLSPLNLVSRVIFPALSRLQGDWVRLRATLFETVRYTALVALPLAAGLAILAREFLLAFYGWRWLPALPVLRILAVYGGIRCIVHHFGDGYKAVGRSDVLTRVTALWWLMLPPSLILGAHWGGIAGVAWGQVATRLAMTGLHLYLAVRVLGLSPAALVACFAPAFEVTAALSVFLLALEPQTRALTPREALVCQALGGSLVYLGYLRLRYPDVLRAARLELQRLPAARRRAPQPAAAEAAAARVDGNSAVMAGKEP